MTTTHTIVHICRARRLIASLLEDVESSADEPFASAQCDYLERRLFNVSEELVAALKAEGDRP